MSRFQLACLLALLAVPLALYTTPQPADAQESVEPATPPPTVDAERELAIAELKLRLYRHVEHPLQMRRLTSEIKLAEAEMEMLHRRLRGYQNFRPQKDSALQFSIEQTRLQLLETELKLKDLREERFLLERHHGDQLQLHALLVERARAALSQ